MLKAALWDLDGVVTNTSKTHIHAWAVTLRNHFGDSSLIPDEVIINCFSGVPRFAGIKRCLDFIVSSDESFSRVVNFDEIDSLAFNMSVEVFPDFLDTFDYFKSNTSLINCISSQSENAERVLRRAGIFSLFDVVASGNTAKRFNVPGKPNPEFYRHVASLANISTNQCIVFEDTYAGAYSSVTSGSKLTIGVARDPSKLGELSSAGCDIVTNTLTNLMPLLLL